MHFRMIILAVQRRTVKGKSRSRSGRWPCNGLDYKESKHEKWEWFQDILEVASTDLANGLHVVGI